MAPLTAESLRAALFTSGPYELRPAERFGDVDRDWADPATFTAEPETRPGQRLELARAAAGGGRPELGRQSGDPVLAADGGPGDPADLSAYEGCVLFLETPKNCRCQGGVPDSAEHGRARPAAAFPALLMGRPKTWSFAQPNDPCLGGALRLRAARGGTAGAGRVRPADDGRFRRRPRAHGPAAGHPLRRAGPRRRSRPPDHRDVLRSQADPAGAERRWPSAPAGRATAPARGVRPRRCPSDSAVRPPGPTPPLPAPPASWRRSGW